MQRHPTLGHAVHVPRDAKTQRDHIDEVVGVHMGNDDVVHVEVRPDPQQGGRDAVTAVQHDRVIVLFDEIAGGVAAGRGTRSTRTENCKSHRSHSRKPGCDVLGGAYCAGVYGQPEYPVNRFASLMIYSGMRVARPQPSSLQQTTERWTDQRPPVPWDLVDLCE